MKKTTLLILLLVTSTITAQIDAFSLMGLPSATSNEINAIPTATIQEGAIIYDIDKKTILNYDGTAWKEFMSAPTVSVKTGNYTLKPIDNRNILTFNSQNDIVLTVPAGLSVGFNISIYQIGNGKVTITGAGGVTIKNRLSRFRTAGLDAGVGIVCTAPNIFHVTGDLRI
ncbi:hypothetical protein ACE939_07105 [Aquimarina sp. W85]|uniref:hypothetical protein n=1 Tax=Aquimarina rhodophyticola TaxID=3342246 RepID=UPI00366F94FD